MFTACILWAGDESVDPAGAVRGDVVKIYRSADICNDAGTALRDPPSLTQPLGFIHVSTLATERPVLDRVRSLLESPIVGADDLPIRRRGCSVVIADLPSRVRNDLNLRRESTMTLLGFLAVLKRRSVVDPGDRLRDSRTGTVSLIELL